jgi:putative serine protease PepD
VLGALAAGVGIGAGVYASVAPSRTTTVLEAGTGRSEDTSAATAGALSINAIYERTHEGVVDITVDATAQSQTPTGFGFGSQQTQAEGSGWIYDSKGDIVTNQHVVAGATSIRVTFANGKSYGAQLVGSDVSTDLAVVRVAAPSSLLTPLQLGDSAAVQVGDPVVAIGSPFGLPQTVTSGIVSALHRTIDSPNNFTIANAIQTDAPINHGNSGGPLLNAAAQVIGVNSQIQSQSGGNEGVGFAIPSNTVRTVAAQIVAGKAPAHAYLGVEVRSSASPLGAAVARILPGTPAAKAGLKAGDVITALDGRAVTGDADVSTIIGAKKPGQVLTVTYQRGSTIATIKVELTARPS